MDEVLPGLVEAFNPDSRLSLTGFGLSMSETTVRFLSSVDYTSCYDATVGHSSTTTHVEASQTSAAVVVDNFGMGLPVGTYLVCTGVAFERGYTLQPLRLDAAIIHGRTRTFIWTKEQRALFLIRGVLLSRVMRVWLVPGRNCTESSTLPSVEAAVEEVSADRSTLFVYANGSQLSDFAVYSTCVSFQSGMPLVLVNETGLLPGLSRRNLFSSFFVLW